MASHTPVVEDLLSTGKKGETRFPVMQSSQSQCQKAWVSSRKVPHALRSSKDKLSKSDTTRSRYPYAEIYNEGCRLISKVASLLVS